MIVALLALAFSIAQVVIAKDLISHHDRFVVVLTFAIVSVIPVLVQLLILGVELWRAGRHCLKLLVQRLILNCLGNYGQGLPLVLQYWGPLHTSPSGASSFVAERPSFFKFTRSLQEPPTFWKFLLCVTRTLKTFFPHGYLTFGDPFSGEYQLKSRSVALWMTDYAESWDKWYCGTEPLNEDVWEGSKEIRGVEMIWRFGHGSGNRGYSENGRVVRVLAWEDQFGFDFHIETSLTDRKTPEDLGDKRATAWAIRATVGNGLSGLLRLRPKEGSGFLVNLHFYQAWGLYKVPVQNYIRFCNVMKAMTDDTFFVRLVRAGI